MLIDAHTHLNLSAFKNDYQDAALRALEKNVWLVNVGTDFESSKRAVEIAGEFENGIFAAIGVHPTDFSGDFNKEKFLELAKNKKVVAIGECGLDYARIQNSELRIKNSQKELFIKHIELANETKKPLIIHCRDAHDDLVEILNSQSSILNSLPGVMHFFGGPGAWENVDKYLDLGFYISFAGIITFSKYANFEDISRLPLNRILIETDAPFAAPEPYRGQRNEPVYVIEIAKKLAEILKISFKEVCEITAKNAKKVFNIS